MSFKFKNFEEIKNSIDDTISVKHSAEQFCKIYESLYKFILISSLIILQFVLFFQAEKIFGYFDKYEYYLIDHIFLYIYGNGIFLLLITIVFGFFSTVVSTHNMLKKITEEMK